MKRHEPLSTHVGLAALTAATTYTTLLSWRGFAEDPGAYLVPIFWASLCIAAIGAILRAVGLPALLVLLAQIAGAGLVLNRRWAAAESLGGFIPTADSLQHLGLLVNAAAIEAGSYAAPVPETALRFPALMVVSGVVVVLVVDFLAGGLRRIPLAGLPLLAAFTAPVSILGGVSWLTFGLAAFAFVLLLAMDRAARLARWGNQLPSTPAALPGMVVDNQPREVRLGTIWPLASRLGAAGVGLAVLAPAILPSTSGLFNAAGGGVGGDDVRISNPMVDVRRDLTRGDDIPLLRVQTDDPTPSYLRITVLDEYDGETWRPSERNIPESNRVGERLPPAPGLSSDTKRQRHTTQITGLSGFSSTWLPLFYPATSVSALGDWRYDAETFDVVAASDDLTTTGLTYLSTALSVQPEVGQLVNALPAPRGVAVRNTRLPDTTPEWVGQLADEVTDGAASPFERAVKLQDWFRRDGNFTYSLDRAPGSSLRQLELFLGEGPGSREGYCEQFAATMAIMARTLNIPARVAVGFLRPDSVGAGEFVYSTYDMHAWPELYFEGAGWIRFEPTPQDRADGVPAYTTARIPQPQEVELPTAVPSAAVPTPARPELDSERSQAGASESSEEGAGRLWLGGIALMVLLAAVVTGPRVARAALRRRRLRASGEQPVEAGWTEVRATALDLGLEWDDRETLRRRAVALAHHLGGDRAAIGSLERLVLLVERSRYARLGLTDGPTYDAADLVRSVTAALRVDASPAARGRAEWLPASLWRGWRHQRNRGGASGSTAERELDLVSL